MVLKKTVPLLIVIISFNSCKKDSKTPVNNNSNCSHSAITSPNPRTFKMGFSTWSYGPDLQDVDDTYNFLSENGDIYSEQIDHKIPWSAWINTTPLPQAFTNEIDAKVAKRIPGLELSLSVSLLNTSRNNLLEDYNDSIPNYNALNDTVIENAYFKHLDYLIGRFQPDYLIAAMEINDLLKASSTKWNEYKSLMLQIRSRLKQKYPNLQVSESVTLHNWYASNNAQEISNYVQQLDFTAVSFYPFLAGLNSIQQFEDAFSFLVQNAHNIAIVETAQPGENLDIPNLNISIKANKCKQLEYCKALLQKADQNNFRFVIWWAHRDYDKLWNNFPPDQKDIGKIWRDTGLLDEDGNPRPAYNQWKEYFEN